MCSADLKVGDEIVINRVTYVVKKSESKYLLDAAYVLRKPKVFDTLCKLNEFVFKPRN